MHVHAAVQGKELFTQEQRLVSQPLAQLQQVSCNNAAGAGEFVIDTTLSKEFLTSQPQPFGVDA